VQTPALLDIKNIVKKKVKDNCQMLIKRKANIAKKLRTRPTWSRQKIDSQAELKQIQTKDITK